MKNLSSWTALSLLLSSCGPTIDVAPPPDVREELAAYENPNGDVKSEIMASVADQIDEVRDDIENSEVYREILSVIADVQSELEASTDEDGNLTIDGVPFPNPNGALEANFICEGWDQNQTELDPTNGEVQLTLTLGPGGIGPLVWGEAEACKFPVEIGTERFDASYNGSIAVHLGRFVSMGENLYELPITFFVTGAIGFEGVELPINHSFRVTFDLDEAKQVQGLKRLEILIPVPDDLVTVPGAREAFIYFFDFTDAGQGIHDINGEFGCSLERSECFNDSGTLFSW